VKENLMGQMLLQGQSRDGLYPIFLSKSVNKVRKFAAFLGKIWHNRLGHQASPILNKVKQLARISIVGSSSIESLYKSCQVAKSKCLPFSASPNVTVEPLEIIHFDVWSSLILSINGYLYYVVFINN
jgi:hypothetical protein